MIKISSLAIAAGLALSAQTPPSFEVVSIRRNLTGEQNTQINTSGARLTINNGSLKTLIRNAYDVLPFQLIGGPRWLDTEMYNIIATAPAKIGQDQLRLLFQSLLAERFQLKVHWETRETTVYALVVDKGGPKFKENLEPGEPVINTRKARNDAQMQGTRQTISILASNLGNQLGRIVVDKTGLSGNYDWLLKWDPDPTVDSALPSLLTALPQQLGLKLESQKGPMQALVIDSVEKPSEN